MSNDDEKNDFKLYRRRYWITSLFFICTLANGYQWIQYSVIQDEVILFYNRSLPKSKTGKLNAVEATSLVYLLAYLPLIFPSTYILTKYGLRVTTSIGAFLNSLAGIFKCFSIHPDRFIVLMIGQFIAATAQVFILGNPPYLAALWYSKEHISFVTALGVFGNQIGVALGFLIPSEIFSGLNDSKLIELRFRQTMIPLTVIMILNFLLITVIFRSKPKTPPSNAQLQLLVTEKIQYISSLKELFSNFHFVGLFLSYGILTGAFYSISTNLDSFYSNYHPKMPKAPGHVGLIIVLSGLFGSVIAGILLDKTKAFKFLACFTCLASFLLMITFTFVLSYNLYVSYVVAFFLGFFVTGYLPIGFEMAAEITYPINEGVSSGMLNVSAHIFGIIMTKVQSAMISWKKVLGSNLFICIMLGLGTLAISVTKPVLKRMEAQINSSNSTKQTENVSNESSSDI